LFEGEVRDALAVVEKNPVRKNEQAIRPILAQASENPIQIFGFLNVQLLQPYAQSLRGGERLTHRADMKRVERIEHHSDMRKPGRNFPQQLKPFAFQIGRD
jgi:hypothetical protein